MSLATGTHDMQIPQLSTLMVARLNLIWQMGEASLTSNGNEIRLPLQMSKQLQGFEIKEIQKRLSRKLNDAPTFYFEDPDLQVLRICAVVDESPVASSSTLQSPGSTTPASPPASTSSATSAEPSKIFHNKNSKVARPPNAFILYRQKWHPQIKQQNPGIHNNDISVLLGKQWKAESENVKQDFRDMAERLKLQHAIDNPGYQYAPRKASEKKRRMTAKKLAQMLQSQEDQLALRRSSLNTWMTLQQHGTPATPASQGSPVLAQIPLPTLDDLLAIDRPMDNGGISFTENADVQFTLPSPNQQAIDGINYLNTQVEPNNLASPNQTGVTTTTSEHTESVEDFLNSLIDIDAWDGVRFVSEADIATMAAADQLDNNLPHFAPMDPAEFSSAQSELEDAINFLP